MSCSSSSSRVGHERGSSHGASRIFRLSYPDPHFVRLAQGALQSWRELEAECGEQLIVQTGGLDFGRVATENARALATCGVRHELLTGAEVAARWPIAAEADEQVLYQPDGGTTLADRAYRALLDGSRRRGRRRPRPPARHPDRARAGVRPDPDDRGRDHGARLCRGGGRVGPRPARRGRDRASGRSDARDGHVLQPSRPARAATGHRRCRAGRGGARPPATRTDQLRARGTGNRPQGGAPPRRAACRSRRAGHARRRRSSAGCRPGPRDAIRSSIRSRSRRRPASTRTRPTSRSCSNGTVASSSRRPARATASSSRPRSGGRSRHSPATQPPDPAATGLGRFRRAAARRSASSPRAATPRPGTSRRGAPRAHASP